MDPEPYNTINVESEESEEVEPSEPLDILLTEKGQKFLNQTRPWVRFLSIMVFIGAGFMVIGGLAMLLLSMTGSLVGAGSDTFGILPGQSVIIGLIYVVLSILYIAPGIFLFRYATAIKVLKSMRTSQALENALKYQRSFWCYVGILTVICLVITAAAIAFSMAVGFFMFLNK